MDLAARIGTMAGNSEDAMYKELYYNLCESFTSNSLAEEIVIDAHGKILRSYFIYGNAKMNNGVKKITVINATSINTSFRGSGGTLEEVVVEGSGSLGFAYAFYDAATIKTIRIKGFNSLIQGNISSLVRTNALNDIFFDSIPMSVINTESFITGSGIAEGVTVHCSDGSFVVGAASTEEGVVV